MPLRSVSPAVPISSTPPSRRPSSGAPQHSLRAPLVGCLWVLSLGAFSALAFNMGCAQSYRRIPFLGVKSVDKQSASSLRSTGMIATSTTVPSIVVYVTVPNKEAGKKLAESIIQEKLAACVNQAPGMCKIITLYMAKCKNLIHFSYLWHGMYFRYIDITYI
ncbi:CutA1 divalent ion tolerance protein [Musa troglodytarum]|uniref:CutA1 divalent ion tolerance protein n=1 Tax=Musa troglodytarum TaxID=320322 RepID=A0A9E7F4E1_9LILI|nr:CutA1 divalent ion tolerance protein [Musa troglodytarum]